MKKFFILFHIEGQILGAEEIFVSKEKSPKDLRKYNFICNKVISSAEDNSFLWKKKEERNIGEDKSSGAGKDDFYIKKGLHRG